MITPSERLARAVHDFVDDSLQGPELIPAGTVRDGVLGVTDRALIENVLVRNGRNFTRTAAMLGINRNTLRKRMRELGIR